MYKKIEKVVKRGSEVHSEGTMAKDPISGLQVVFKLKNLKIHLICSAHKC